MWPNPQFPADLVTFTEEVLNGKLHCAMIIVRYVYYHEFIQVCFFISPFKGVTIPPQKSLHIEIISSLLKLQTRYFTLTEKELLLYMTALDSHQFLFLCLVDSWCHLQNYPLVIKVHLNKYINTFAFLFNEGYIIFVRRSFNRASI